MTAKRCLDQGHIDKLSATPGGPALWRYYYDADGKRRIKAPGSGPDITTNASYSFYEGEEGTTSHIQHECH